MTNETEMEITHKKTHVNALPIWPEFKQDSSGMDGLIPACRVESWQRFMEVMRAPEFKKTSRELIFRGQRGCDWPLSSTLGRKFDAGSIPWQRRSDLLYQFELAMRGRGYDLSALNDEVEKWAIGQHHGLCTPLLDWTRSPFVALFFAFNRPDGSLGENPSRAVFCINMSALVNVFEDDEPLFIEPRNHNNARLVNQAGLFTLTPSDEDNIAGYIVNRLLTEEIVSAESATTNPVTIEGETPEETKTEFQVADNLASELAQFIFKVHIPNDDRTGCLDLLRKMNIHNGSLFPDAQGASLFCNDWLDRILDEEKQDAVRKSEPPTIDVALGKDAWEQSGDVLEGLRAILVQAADHIGIKLDDADGLAKKLDNRFQSAQSIDWPKSESKTARIRTSLRRLLLSLEYPTEYTDHVLGAILDFYEGVST